MLPSLPPTSPHAQRPSSTTGQGTPTRATKHWLGFLVTMLFAESTTRKHRCKPANPPTQRTRTPTTNPQSSQTSWQAAVGSLEIGHWGNLAYHLHPSPTQPARSPLTAAHGPLPRSTQPENEWPSRLLRYILDCIAGGRSTRDPDPAARPASTCLTRRSLALTSAPEELHTSTGYHRTQP